MVLMILRIRRVKIIKIIRHRNRPFNLFHTYYYKPFCDKIMITYRKNTD